MKQIMVPYPEMTDIFFETKNSSRLFWLSKGIWLTNVLSKNTYLTWNTLTKIFKKYIYILQITFSLKLISIDISMRYWWSRCHKFISDLNSAFWFVYWFTIFYVAVKKYAKWNKVKQDSTIPNNRCGIFSPIFCQVLRRMNYDDLKLL